MAGINAQINLVDNFSSPMQRMIEITEELIGRINRIESTMNSGFVAEPVHEATIATEKLATGMTSVENNIIQTATAAQSLTNAVSEVGNSITEAGVKQANFNNTVSHGRLAMGGLVAKAAALVSAYMGVGKLVNMSDEITLTTARLDIMNDKVQTTPELLEMVYQSAQNARGSFSNMAEVVTRFGNNAKDAFSSSKEVVDFTNLVQKQMVIVGAGTQESANAMLQLSQALGSGVLRGDELKSIFEQAPNLIQTIADYMNVPISSIRELAEEGKITTDIVKNAVLGSADKINEKFESMPMTWGQVWNIMSNAAEMKMQPVLAKINELANNRQFQTFAENAVNALAMVVNILLSITGIAGMVANFIGENWSIIEPIVLGIAAALALYSGALVIHKGILLASAAAHGIVAAAKALHTGLTQAWSIATFIATVKQKGLNAALAACPLVWIIGLLIAVIAVIFATAAAIAKMTGVANSGFGVITGGISVVIQCFKNFGLFVANTALGIINAMGALCYNIKATFHNAISAVQSWFYDMLSTALSVVSSIAKALNSLPFVEFDYSGIVNAANDYAAKSAEAAGNRMEYQDIGAAYQKGKSTFNAFNDGWASDAFKKGAAWGDGVTDTLSRKLNGFVNPNTGNSTPDIFNGAGYTTGNYSASNVPTDIANIAKNTGRTADSLSIASEDLKYMKDIAERDAINRFTTAEIKIDMTNNNNISSGMDLDGLVSDLAEKAEEALNKAAEGVHK